ncbi:MAG: hypothetical protein ABR555_00705 [Pyrinomonadaceae bacterium]
MTKLGRSKTIRFLGFVVLVIGAASCSQKSPSVSEPIAKPAASSPEKTSASVREQIAKTYGLDEFATVEAIRYTWNAQFPGVNVSRSWIWEPKTGQVSYEGKDKDGKLVKATYVRSQLNSQPENVKNEIDPAFVNDNYWLLFPLHAHWDSSADVQDKGTRPLPQGNGSADLVSVKYPPDGGYTPGDTWDLYVGKDNRVEQFVYHRGGTRKPGVVIATWEGYKKAGPLLISTDHNGTADGNTTRIFISDLAVKVTGSENWITAQ